MKDQKLYKPREPQSYEQHLKKQRNFERKEREQTHGTYSKWRNKESELVHKYGASSERERRPRDNKRSYDVSKRAEWIDTDRQHGKRSWSQKERMSRRWAPYGHHM